MTSKTLPKPSPSNKQVLEYTKAVDKGYNSLFVVATDKGWVLRHASSTKSLDTFTDKASALSSARKLAATEKTSVFVFNESGELLSNK
jgi:hypothetical protein